MASETLDSEEKPFCSAGRSPGETSQGDGRNHFAVSMGAILPSPEPCSSPIEGKRLRGYMLKVQV